MRNYTLIVVFICFITSVSAQTDNQAIGIRFGGGDGTESEISYQQYIGGPNRLEFDLGFFDNGWDEGFKFTLLYQLLGNIEGGLNWYLGVGGSIGGRDIDSNDKHWNDDSDDGLFLNVDGQLGIEYNFSIPLQLSIDARPEFGLINDDFDFGYGLGIRYTF